MKIGIEAERANIDNPTGVEHYAQQILLGLASSDHENSYVLYLRTPPKTWMLSLPKNFVIKVIPFPIFWTQLRISWEVFWHPLDALFIMASALPLLHPKKSIVTIHDIAWKFYPETFSWSMRNYLRFSTWFAVKQAHTIIAVSEQTKKDLIKFYKLPPEKVVVIYHGFDQQSEVEVHSGQEELLKLNDLPKKFILYLGTLQPRKNITGLIDAYQLLRKNNAIYGYKLVIAGGKGWLYEEIMKRIAKDDSIKYFGYVQDRFALLRRAGLLVQPAFYEGFGLQILDAFSVKVPVACSNVSSLPEVAGPAAAYFDPEKPEEIAKAIERIISSTEYAADLVEQGSARLKQFTWKKTVDETLAVLTK
jgi:glycosyltransferase involved in cell wall biosynthesis